MASTQDILLPDIGDFDQVDVIEVLVSPGDNVNKEDSLITLESEKATMEVPSPYEGTVKDIQVKVGDKVAKGKKILTMDVAAEGEEQAPAKPAPEHPAAEAAEKAPVSGPAPEKEEKPQPTPSAEQTGDTGQRPPPVAGGIDEEAFAKAYASPSVRRFARELGVDLGKISGSGRKGRILKEDVQAFVKSRLAGGAEGAPGAAGPALPSMPEVDFTKFGETETQPLSRIKQKSAANLHRNWVNIPHVTQFDEADITDMEAFRKEQAAELKAQGVKLSPLAFLLKASVAALQAFPQFNTSLHPEGDKLIYKKYYHIGVAVDTPDGLVVPVIRDVDQKGLVELAKELAEMAEKARRKKLSPSDMQGGCFSISSLGGIGGTAFTPIINAPEVAILGVSRSEMKPVYRNGEFEPRLMLPLSLAYDHRVIDGAEAARFVVYLSSVLSDVRRMLL